MCNHSPSKILRNVKRMTKFLENKSHLNHTLPKPEEPQLSIQIPPNIDIPPSSNIEASQPRQLSVIRQSTITIPPKPRNLSFRKFFPTEIVPGSRWEDDILFSSYINGGTHTTTFVCHICYDDFTYKSADAIRSHIQSFHPQDMYYRLKNHLNFHPKFEDLN